MRHIACLLRPMLASAFCLAISSVHAQQRTWTTTADFNSGVHLNTSAAIVPNELRMSPQGSAPTPYLSIPIGGRRLASFAGYPYTPGRIARLDTRTGVVLGDYRCVPDQLESSPSRAVVDSQGNTWVTSQYASSGTVSVTKIGIIVGGTRYFKISEGVYVLDPIGEYVKDPQYTTGVDRDGDGYIRTSRGLGYSLAWNATAGRDLDSSITPGNDGIVEEADDELILVFKRFPGTTGESDNFYSRGNSIDPEDNVWFGRHENFTPKLTKVDSQTGVDLINFTGPRAGYTQLWIGGKIVASTALGMTITDAVTGTTVNAPAGTYGAIAPLSATEVVCPGINSNEVARVLDINTGAVVRTFPTQHGDARGITVGTDGDIWICSRVLSIAGTMGVFRYRPDGTLVKRFETGLNPSGVGVDADGNIWVTHVKSDYAVKINPTLDGGLGRIVGNVYLGIGSYNYSDGTGATSVTVGRDAEWRGIYDSFRPNLKWGVVSWNATVPSGTQMEVYARSANQLLQLNGQGWTQIPASGFNLSGLVQGRYVEMRVRMSRDENITASPSLRDLTVRFAPGTISGTTAMEGWLPEGLPNTTMELVPVGGGSPITFNPVELGPLGAWAITTTNRGDHELYVKSSHWLRQKLPNFITITDNGVHGLGFYLLNGDCDGDNEVGPGDFAILADAFLSVDGDPNWNVVADLDGDGEVGPGDFGLLSTNFLAAGD